MANRSKDSYKDENAQLKKRIRELGEGIGILPSGDLGP